MIDKDLFKKQLEQVPAPSVLYALELTDYINKINESTTEFILKLIEVKEEDFHLYVEIENREFRLQDVIPHIKKISSNNL